MKKYNETFKAVLSNGKTDTVSAQSLYEAKRWFEREYVKDADGEPTGVTIAELTQITNYNK